jgi:hypothetical protein
MTTKAKQQTWPEKILAQVAAGKGMLAELDKLPKANPDSIRWYCSQMTKAGQLVRTGVGTYALSAKKKTAKRRKAARK